MYRKKKASQQKDLDSQFEAFLKASMSSDESSLDTARVNKFLQNNKKTEDRPWWANGDDDSISDGGVGLSGTGRSFLKKKPDPAKEKLPDAKPQNNHKKEATMTTTGGFEVNMSRDSLDDMSLRGRDSTEMFHNGPSVPALALDSSNSFTETGTRDKSHLGLETLQEMADKEQFFEDLQKNSGDSTIDFSRLNREIDKSATLQGTLSSEMGNHYNKECDGEHSSDEDDGRPMYRPPETREDVAQVNGEKNPSMLSKVALMDSLDSTLGTKYASQETRPEDMKPIPENTEREDDECDGSGTGYRVGHAARASQLADSRGMDKTTSEQTAKGLTLKTGTGGTGGFGYTDTSHEMEALQAALQQVGMSTMGSTRDLNLSSSVFTGTGAVGESHAMQGTADGVTASTPGFGLKGIVANSAADSRTVDEIIQEVEELRKTGEDDGRPGVRFLSEEDEDGRGFDLTPVHSQDQQGFDLSPVQTGAYGDGPDGTDISPLEKFIDSHPFEDYGSSSSLLPVPAPRSLRQVPYKKKPKEKFPHVRSSGYGAQADSPPRRPNKVTRPGASPKGSNSKQAWSPADTSKQKVKGTEVLRRAGGKMVTEDPVDNQLVASVQSFAQYIQTHFTESLDLDGKNNLMPGVKFSQDEPALSSSQKLPALERERALVKEVKEWQDLWKQEQHMHAKVKAELDNTQREYERKFETMRLEHDEEMFKLKQENFVLSAKVAQDEGEAASRRTSVLEEVGEGTVSKEQVALLEKEVREQEGLLAGYQAENERLYQELKKMQKMSKTTEQQMFKENQRLTTEVSHLKQQLEQREIEARHRGVITSPAVQQQIAAGNMPPGANLPTAALGAARIAMLEAELKQARARELAHQSELEAAGRAKQEVEKQAEQLTDQLGRFEQTVKAAKDSQSQEAKEVEAKYTEELEKLTRRLKWYAENQELLDRDHQLLKKKDEDIRGLKDKIEHLNSEHGRRQAEAKARVKERAGDARKIQDLHRQVREMESIIRKRHPNSLPVLMWAANAAVENHPTEGEGSKPLSVRYLEDRCKKLEAEVDSKDEEAKKSLRVMEQKYTSMKYQYEDRIKTLEMTLAKHEHPGEGDHPHSHAVALQRELDGVRERYKKQVAELEAETDRQRKELALQRGKELASSKADLRAAQTSEQELQSRVRVLEGQLLDKEKERASLAVSLDRSQKEKQQLTTEVARLSEKPPASRGLISSDRGRRPRSGSRTRPGVSRKPGTQDSFSSKRTASQDSLGTNKRAGSRESLVESEPLPAYRGTGTRDKQYEPTSFSGLHIEDVVREKEQLKTEVERLQLEVDHSRVNNQKLLAEAEGRERRSTEHTDEQLSALRLSHQMEVQKLMSEHAMAHSTSRVAELQGRADTQEVMIRHLKEQLSDCRVDSEQLAALKVRTTTLESQVTELLGELQQARKNQPPEMRHYVALQDQIKKLEERHRRREHELKQIIHQAQSMAAADMELETAKWRKIVDAKNREIEKFRAELDTILQVLQELRRQGVALPGTTAGSSGSSSRGGSSRHSDSR